MAGYTLATWVRLPLVGTVHPATTIKLIFVLDNKWPSPSKIPALSSVVVGF